MNHSFTGDFITVQEDFNHAVSTLHATMERISANSAEIKSGSGEISKASDDLSLRTEQQAASLEQTVAALDQIAQAVKRSAEHASQAKHLAEKAKNDAVFGGDIVRKAVDAMAKIEQSSGQVRAYSQDHTSRTATGIMSVTTVSDAHERHDEICILMNAQNTILKYSDENDNSRHLHAGNCYHRVLKT